MSTTEPADYLTVAELAEFLRVGKTVAYQLVNRGEVPRARVGGQWRIPRRELERQLAGQGKPAA